MTLSYHTPGQPTLLPDELRQAIPPLRLIFWGALLLILDLSFTQTTNNTGIKFDICNDALGMALIVYAVFRLRTMRVPGNYRPVMTFIAVMAVIGLLESLHDHIIYQTPDFLSLLRSLTGILQLLATTLFCVAMRWLSIHAGLPAAAGLWRITTWLFGLIYLLPLGLLYLAGFAAFFTGASINLQLGPAGLILLPLFLAPVISFFIATSKMKNEMTERQTQ